MLVERIVSVQGSIRSFINRDKDLFYRCKCDIACAYTIGSGKYVSYNCKDTGAKVCTNSLSVIRNNQQLDECFKDHTGFNDVARHNRLCGTFHRYLHNPYSLRSFIKLS